MDIISLQPLHLETLSMQALEPLHAAFDQDFNDKQREFAEVIFLGLMNSGVAKACAPHDLAEAALAVLVQTSHDLGGVAVYVGKLENVRQARMYRAIHASFTGNNHKELALEHGISEMRVRQILSSNQPKKGAK